MFYEKNASSIPSTKPFNGLTNKPTQSIISKPTTTTNTILGEQMPRSKSYKDLSDPPIAHPIYYQQYPSTIEYQRQQLISDDISSSSTGHLPKPPPGIPSQNAR